MSESHGVGTLTLHTFPLPDNVQGSARWCTCRPPADEPCHRYVLYRELANYELLPTDRRTLACIGMNPSAAHANVDDTTVRLLWRLAEREGFNRLVMLNAFAYRSTNPAGMNALGPTQAVGPDNDAHLLREVAEASKILACWGSIDRDRDAHLRWLLEPFEVYCLGLTKARQPLHPLHAKTKGVEWVRLPAAA